MSPELIDVNTGRSKKFDSFECPVIDMKVGGKVRRVFIDSGAPFSVYNPPKEEKDRADIEGVLKYSSSKLNCKFRGVGRGEYPSQRERVFAN